MQTRVLTTADADIWRGYLDCLPGADIYHTPEYHAAHEANGDGQALCFVAEDYQGELLFHATMVRSIPSSLYRDAESVYGYSGPLCTPGETNLHVLGWQRYGEEMRYRGVVAEFVRFNPISGNHVVMHGATQDRETVVVDLSGSPDDLWARYPKVQRNMVRKAESRGLTVEQGTNCDDWRLVRMCYEGTMDRNNACNYYHFAPAYWQSLETGQSWRRLFCVEDKAIHGIRFFVAGAVFLTYGDRMHYHLSGSDEGFLDSGATNLLLHTAALWGQTHGYRWLHLGGGRTNAPDDSLLRFKASISKDRLPFYTGRRIHDEAAYRQLCDDWRARHPGQDGGGYFLLWRKP